MVNPNEIGNRKQSKPPSIFINRIGMTGMMSGK